MIDVAERRIVNMRDMQQAAGESVGIPCRECGSTNSRVWTTRQRVGLVRRVRECIACGARRVTTEQ